MIAVISVTNPSGTFLRVMGNKHIALWVVFILVQSHYFFSAMCISVWGFWNDPDDRIYFHMQLSSEGQAI
jgi:hypothetical protein